MASHSLPAGTPDSPGWVSLAVFADAISPASKGLMDTTGKVLLEEAIASRV